MVGGRGVLGVRHPAQPHVRRHQPGVCAPVHGGVLRRPPRRGRRPGCLLPGRLACFGGWNGFVRGFTVVFVLAAWAVGRILSARSAMVEELRSNNELLAGQREARLRQAVAEERTRIARDLHDSIGHYLTIIALQAGAARRMWTSDPPKAAAALATVARVAAQGSAELRMGFDSGLVPQAALPRAPTSPRCSTTRARRGCP